MPPQSHCVETVIGFRYTYAWAHMLICADGEMECVKIVWFLAGPMNQLAGTFLQKASNLLA